MRKMKNRKKKELPRRKLRRNRKIKVKKKNLQNK